MVAQAGAFAGALSGLGGAGGAAGGAGGFDPSVLIKGLGLLGGAGGGRAGQRLSAAPSAPGLQPLRPQPNSLPIEALLQLAALSGQGPQAAPVPTLGSLIAGGG